MTVSRIHIYKLLGILLLMLPISNIYAQTAADSIWIKSFGGGDKDEASVIRQTTDHGFIFAGGLDRNHLESYDIFIVKTDSAGNIQWTRTIESSRSESALDIIQTVDSGYALVGYQEQEAAGNNDVYFIKLNADGDTLWSHTYGGYETDAARSVVQTKDYGYAITGRTDSQGAGGSDIYLIKTDSSGRMQWSRTIGGSGNEWANVVRQTPDHGYILAGETDSNNGRSFNIYVVRTDSSGNPLWWNSRGMLHDEEAYDVQLTPDSGFIVAGHSSSTSVRGDQLYLLKYDRTGELLWSNGFDYDYSYLNHVMVRVMKEGYLLTAYRFSFGSGDRKAVLMRIDDSGELFWNKIYNGEGGRGSRNIGGYWISAASASIGRGLHDYNEPEYIPDSTTFSFSPAVPMPRTHLSSDETYRFYPITTLTFCLEHITPVEMTLQSVTDNTSVSLLNCRSEPGRHTFLLDSRSLPPGVYLLHFKSDQYSTTRKILILR
jgi:hypothetical protein